MLRKINCLLIGLLITILAGIGYADIPKSINYQGRLTNVGGTPVTDGNYNITFVIWNLAAGGVSQWSSGLVSVAVSDGFFEVQLGGNPMPVLPDNLFSNATERWLGITIGIDPEQSPRTKLASNAWAFQSLRADTANVIAGDPFVNETGDFMTGPLSIDFGANATTEFQIRQDGGSATVMELSDNGIMYCQLVADDKGHLILHDASGDPAVILDATGAGGGFLDLNKGDGTNLAYIGGSTSGSIDLFDGTGSEQTVYLDALNNSGGRLLLRREDGSPSVSLTAGSTVVGGSLSMVNLGGSVVIDLEPALTGTNQVQIGVDAIDEFEMQDEPGLAASKTSNFGLLSLPVQNVLSRTINAPGFDSGYVFAIGTLQVGFVHSSGTTSTANFSVSTTSVTHPAGGSYIGQISSAAPSGTYIMTITVQGVFKVSAFADIFYLIAEAVSGAITVNDAHLTLLWFPTAYGTVTETAPAFTENSEVSATDANFEAERMQKENLIMKERMKSLENRLSAIEGELSASGDQE